MKPSCGKQFGNYLVVLYFICKILYIANGICQLFFLSPILGLNFTTFGVDIIHKMIEDETHGTVHTETSAFPKVTMCNFKVRRLGNVHCYAMQCVLPINLYAEKIYVFLWCWIVLVLALTILSIITWFLQMTVPNDKLRYIQNHLEAGERFDSIFDKQLSHDFVDHYLRSDGVFILKLISHNTNGLTSTEVICALWDLWKTGNPVSKETPPPPPELDDAKPPPPPENTAPPPLYPTAPEPFVDPLNDIPPLEGGEKPNAKPPKPPPPPKPAKLKGSQ